MCLGCNINVKIVKHINFDNTNFQITHFKFMIIILKVLQKCLKKI